MAVEDLMAGMMAEVQGQLAYLGTDGADLFGEEGGITGKGHQSAERDAVRGKFEQRCDVLSRLQAGEQLKVAGL